VIEATEVKMCLKIEISLTLKQMGFLQLHPYWLYFALHSLLSLQSFNGSDVGNCAWNFGAAVNRCLTDVAEFSMV